MRLELGDTHTSSGKYKRLKKRKTINLCVLHELDLNTKEKLEFEEF